MLILSYRYGSLTVLDERLQIGLRAEELRRALILAGLT